MSEHKNLAEALAAFQGEAPTLRKTNEVKGSFTYKYVDLADVVEEVKPLMAKHGLAWSAFPCIGPDGKPALRYKLSHASGDSEGEVMSLMLAKADAQAHGSAITYARRYALCAVLNLVADADDDGHRASQPRTANYGSHRPNAIQSQSPDLVTAEDIKTLAKVVKDKGLTVGQVKQAFVEVGLPRPEGPPSTLFMRVPREKAALLAEAFTAIPAPELS